MTSFVNSISLIAATGLALSQGAMPAAAKGPRDLRVGPLAGITLSVDNTRAIGYFVSKNSACDTTIHLAEAFDESRDATQKPVRIALQIPAGSDARVTTVSGKALRFVCSKDATAMTILPVKQMAYVAPAK